MTRASNVRGVESIKNQSRWGDLGTVFGFVIAFSLA